jgi:diguanylate cyclase (GGDEF)-like protein/PAS domain S-box-containing protein
MIMSAALANSSIRARLSILIVLNSSLALLLAGIALFGYETYQQREAATRELSSQAGILAETSTAALSFNDDRAAAQTLAALNGESHVVEAVIYDSNNVPFARYRREGIPTGISPVKPRPVGAYFEAGAVLVFQPIRLRGERIGTIFLRSTNEVSARLRRYTAILCLVMLLSLGVALVFSFGTQRSVANPLTELSGIAQRVSFDKNYAVRAIRRTGGEIGILVDSFNDMLSQIEARETERKAAEESLRESEERYALAARGANDGLWDWKLTTNEIYFSPRWNQMLGLAEDNKWSDPEEWFLRIHPSDRERVRTEAGAILNGKRSEFNSEYRMYHKNGSFIWVLTRGIAIRDENGAAIRMAGSQTDITEGKVADPLTGLPNRLYFIERLDCAFESAFQRSTLFAVLFLDLDKFKLVNDSLGHAAGDELLMGVAERLRGAVRESGRNGGLTRIPVVARLGGDEFAILLDDVGDEADAAIVADSILEKLKAPFNLEGRQMFASASIGIALSSSGHTPEELLRNADTAMYHAKAMGKSRFEVFDERMRERAVARFEIETDLRNAIGTQQLILHYQPEMCLRTQRTIGYEALVRWNHPERGMLGPNEFIPIAEESDLILQLGRWVLKEACRQMAEWHRAFASDPPRTISVNVSTRQLSDPRFVKDVEEILAETGLDPRCLKLEMTESSIMGKPEATLATLRCLKLMNLGLEIDDFGTGYSSLSHLHLLPFDTVKIDRSFIRELGFASEGSEIVKTILELARSLEMQVVAEGVETREQLGMLTALGCDYVQGFYFSKPVSPQAIAASLEQEKQLQAFRDSLGTDPAGRESAPDRMDTFSQSATP